MTATGTQGFTAPQGPDDPARLPAPKDWHPVGKGTPGPGQDFLSPEDRKRLRGIRRKGADVPPEDVAWLRKMVEELSILRRIDDFIFPEQAALINHISNCGYQIRMARRLEIEQTAVLPGNMIMFQVLEHFIACQPPEAVLVIRPWIEVKEGTAAADVETLSAGTLEFVVDPQIVISEAVRRHLLPGDGRRPFVLDQSVDLFAAVPWRLDDRGNIILTPPFGIFATNGSRLEIRISHGTLEQPVQIRASVLAALYTTKDVGPRSAHLRNRPK